MITELKEYEKSIKKKHSLAWTPKFEEEIRTKLSKGVFVPIVIKTFEKLDWDIVFQDELSVEAKRKKGNNWTEKITVTYEFGTVKVKSVSLGNEMWDNGRNSKRVKLFIHAFHETEKQFDKEALLELEKETKRASAWDDYKIPESLPQPKKRGEPKMFIPIIGGILIALILGFILAFLTIKGKYIIGLFEAGVALVIGFVFKYLIKISNYTHFNNLHYIIIGTIFLTYVSNQFFLYELVMNINNIDPIGFDEFIKLRFREGLTIKSLNTGWIGLVISWILQLGLTWLLSFLRLVSNLTNYQLERVPMEVADFALYHFVKDKTEDQVRTELSKMGWEKKQDQDEVFEYIYAMQTAQEINRGE